MSYRTILVHLHRLDRAREVLNAAVQLAQEHGSRLVAMHSSYRDLLAGTMAGYELSAGTLEHFTKLREAEDAEVKATFDAVMAQYPAVDCDWSSVSATSIDTLVDKLVSRARSCDLAITDGKGTADPLGAWLDLPVRLIIESGRPTLLIPELCESFVTRSRVMIAWNGSREAARAAFDALPILRLAEDVTVATLTSDNRTDAALKESARDLAGALERHGVKSQVRWVMRTGSSDAESLLLAISELGSDLLVMGCYGHSRFRQMIFGGVTREVLAHMTVPILTAH